MPFHVRVWAEHGGNAGGVPEAFAFDLSEGELIRRFVTPWRERQEILCGGSAFGPRDARLEILRNSDYGRKALRTRDDWERTRHRAGTVDVTEHYLIDRVPMSADGRERPISASGSRTYNTTTNVYGSGVAIAVGEDFSQELRPEQTPGDWAALEGSLRATGLTEPWLNELLTAVEHDRALDTAETAQPGAETERWLGRMTRAAGDGTLRLASGVTTGVVVKLVSSFLGIS